MWQRFRPVLWMQVLSTLAISSIAAWFSGVHGAVSATLGGLISIIAGSAFVALAAKSKGRTAGEVLLTALKAEATKIGLIVVLLLVVLLNYQEVIVIGLLGSFVASILIFSIAMAVRET